MKKTALLINQARGRVVNEEALVQALKEGVIGGYASDVYESEPPDPKSELLRFKNVVVSPHLAGGTREARQRVSMAVVGDVLKVLQGYEPENLVNRAVLQRKPL
jgi:phosphoglycerate dehydrogenase-like enzyme